MKGFFYTFLFDICRCVFPPLFLYPFEKKDIKGRPSFYRPATPTQTMGARRVLYCCSVGRASFVTIRHIPFRFRTTRSTNNNNKNERALDIYMDKMAFLPCIYVASCCCCYYSPGLSFLSLSLSLSLTSWVGHGQKSMPGGVCRNSTDSLSLWLSSGGSSTKRTFKTIQGGLKATCFSLSHSLCRQ